MNVRENLMKIFDDLSLIGQDENGEVILYTEMIESIQFISLIVDIESVFEIEIPDEYMLPEFFSSFNNVLDIVNDLINNPVQMIEN